MYFSIYFLTQMQEYFTPIATPFFILFCIVRFRLLFVYHQFLDSVATPPVHCQYDQQYHACIQPLTSRIFNPKIFKSSNGLSNKRTGTRLVPLNSIFNIGKRSFLITFVLTFLDLSSSMSSVGHTFSSGHVCLLNKFLRPNLPCVTPSWIPLIDFIFVDSNMRFRRSYMHILHNKGRSNTPFFDYLPQKQQQDDHLCRDVCNRLNQLYLNEELDCDPPNIQSVYLYRPIDHHLIYTYL